MKKLTLAIVAFLAVGASAQSRHYTTENGMVTATPHGKYETRVVEVTPVRMVPVSTARSTQLLVVPASNTVVVPSRTVLLQTEYDDTADVELLRDRDFRAYDNDGDYDSALDRARYNRDSYYYNYDRD